MIVTESFLIKIHLTPKFIPNKESKLYVDLSILLFTKATIEMFFFCLPNIFHSPSTCLPTEPYTKSLGPKHQSFKKNEQKPSLPQHPRL